MKINSKPCKGSGKAIGFGCGSMQLVRKYGLGLKCGCYHSWLANTPEGQEMIKKAVNYAHRKEIKEAKRIQKEKKESYKSIQALIQDARKPFQRFIRVRDANLSCISCGSIDSELWDAGHFYKAELYSGLIFNEINCNKQCRKCNTYLDGNENNYRIGIIKKYGIEKVKELDQLAIELKSYKYERDELIQIKTKYHKCIK